jgi:hypothetical protein
VSAPSARQVVLRNAGVPGTWTPRRLVMEGEKENFQRTASWYAGEYWQSAKHTPACPWPLRTWNPPAWSAWWPSPGWHITGSSIEEWDPGGLSELIRDQGPILDAAARTIAMPGPQNRTTCPVWDQMRERRLLFGSPWTIVQCN